MADAVLNWVAEAQAAEQATGIPAHVLLGLISVESGGREGLTSSANAGGLTQFIPGTAASYGVDVRPGHAKSQIMGAARYLDDLGFKKDPELALASYNAGPGNPAAAGNYPQKVLAAAKRYAGAAGVSVPTSSSGDRGDASRGAGDELVNGSDGVKALLWIAFAGAGAVLAGLGLGRALGVRKPAGGTI